MDQVLPEHQPSAPVPAELGSRLLTGPTGPIASPPAADSYREIGLEEENGLICEFLFPHVNRSGCFHTLQGSCWERTKPSRQGS